MTAPGQQNKFSLNENLLAALKSNIVPNQEYLLQGSIVDNAVDVLIHRLRGLCDNVDSSTETFQDHEMCYSIRGTHQATNAPQTLVLRVRRSSDKPEMPYQLRYVGQPEIGDKSRPTIVRSCLDIATSESICDFLVELGCRMDFEYNIKGYMFRKGRMKILVYKIFKIFTKGNTIISEESVSQSYLVELSVVAPQGQDTIGEDMKSFADQLRPLVILDKVL